MLRKITPIMSRLDPAVAPLTTVELGMSECSSTRHADPHRYSYILRPQISLKAQISGIGFAWFPTSTLIKASFLRKALICSGLQPNALTFMKTISQPALYCGDCHVLPFHHCNTDTPAPCPPSQLISHILYLYVCNLYRTIKSWNFEIAQRLSAGGGEAGHCSCSQYEIKSPLVLGCRRTYTTSN